MNLDGVLLEDTFSPVIRRLAVAHGVAYTRELESAVLSQPRRVAAQVLARAIGSGVGAGRVTGMYFAERERYVREHPVRLTDGALGLVGRLRGLGWDVVCYGGLGQRHFDRYLGGWRSWFSGPGYVCTDGFRPGIAEIARGCFGLEPSRVLFIDDVARFAVHARAVRAPFIGHPSPSGHGFQREAMREAGVRHLVHRLDAIDGPLLHTLDREAALDTVWPPEHPTPTSTGTSTGTGTGTPALAGAGTGACAGACAGVSAGAGLVPAGKSVLAAGAGSGVGAGAGAGAAVCVGGGRV
ncbi:HAD family phosphatase [Streptomyces sp. NPDC001914]|uniref:HAD family phosphatase n=1 Tax=Streptomyces sp. NPDC001914 TaxID=3364623 RepID=UPI0036AED252